MFDAFDEDKFDFESWAELAQNDPEAFEAKRASLMEEVIAQSPSHYQRRLEGIQFQVDSKRRLAKNPIDALQKIYGMMMDKVYNDNGLLDALESLTKAKSRTPLPPTAQVKRKQAKVIALKKETAEA